jgi:hypothetical protein
VRPDHLLSIARRKLNRPDAVTMSWECIPFDGPTEGVRIVVVDDNINWRNPETVLVDARDEAEEKARFERETGKCHICGGDGQEWRGWDRETGHRWRACKRCSGTGAVPLPEVKK